MGNVFGAKKKTEEITVVGEVSDFFIPVFADIVSQYAGREAPCQACKVGEPVVGGSVSIAFLFHASFVVRQRLGTGRPEQRCATRVITKNIFFFHDTCLEL